ncbi:MAG TPA: TetR/AcrR family transcriptional regulator [Acidobacteriaceae bacterium]
MPVALKTRRQATRRQTSRSRTLAGLRRAEILAAALKVFCKKGYTEARMEDVAAQAKIAKGTLYLYFSSKAEIYSAAAHSGMEQLSTLAVERTAGIADFHTRLETLITVRLDFWMEQRSLYRMLLTVGRAPEHRKQTHAIINRAVASIQSVLEEGVRTGEVAPQPLDPLAQAIVDMMRGAIERRLDGLSKNTSAEDAREISRIAFSALGLPYST